MAENDSPDADISPARTMSASSSQPATLSGSSASRQAAPRQRRGSPVALLPSLLGFFTRHAIRPVASVLRNMALDILGFSLGITTSLVLGALVAGKRRTFRITSPPVSVGAKTICLLRKYQRRPCGLNLSSSFIQILSCHEDVSLPFASQSNMSTPRGASPGTSGDPSALALLAVGRRTLAMQEPPALRCRQVGGTWFEFQYEF